ncbi:pyrimidine 5'-nucleotidase [Rhodovibrionaceae bacterium A322]
MSDQSPTARTTDQGTLPAKDSIDTWVFDLDGTLYAENSGILDQLRSRMVTFVSRHFNLPEDKALDHLRGLLHKHGSSLLALQDLGVFEPEDYVNFVCDVEVGHLPYDEALDQALAKLPGRKVIFTNANAAHAGRVLKQLRLERHFDGIYDVVAGEFIPKPQPATYDRFLQVHEVDPARAIFFEDTEINLKPALARGMSTVWITTPGHRHEDRTERADFVQHRAYDLADWLTRLD